MCIFSFSFFVPHQIINYLSRLSPSTADICKALRQLTSVKTDWTWNATYQKLFDRVKSIIKVDECMTFYDDTKPLYLETDASGIGLGASLLQTRNGTSCPRYMAQDNTYYCPLHLQAKVYPALRRDTSI